MAEQRAVSSCVLIMMVCLVMVRPSSQLLGVIIAGMAADNTVCFGSCMADGEKAEDFGKDCLGGSMRKYTVDTVKDTHSFCSYGCATILWTKLSTKQNPAAKDVERCVRGCSARCAKKN